MSQEKLPQETPIHQHPQVAPTTIGRSATAHGITALALCAIALVITPVLILIPYIGFIPALLAGGGIVAAWIGLRGSTRGTGVAVTGLIVSVVLFALLAGFATMWNVVVADPAIRDYDALHEVIDHIRRLIFGS